MNPIPRYLTAEMKDILAAVAALTFAFTLVTFRSFGVAFGGSILTIALVSFISVVTAFLLHELAHRFVARRFGGIAFFKLWIPGILLVLVTSFLGFLVAAPGAVNIGGVFRRDQIGKTALAGPGTNLAIGSVFYAAFFFIPAGSISPSVHVALLWMSAINLWFGLFNLIPLPPLDGEKIFKWNLELYITVVVAALALNLLNGLFI